MARQGARARLLRSTCVEQVLLFFFFSMHTTWYELNSYDSKIANVKTHSEYSVQSKWPRSVAEEPVAAITILVWPYT